MKKRINKILWYGDELLDEKAKAPGAATSADGLDGLNEGEIYISNNEKDPALFIRTSSGKVVKFSRTDIDALKDIFLSKNEDDKAKGLISFNEGIAIPSGAQEKTYIAPEIKGEWTFNAGIYAEKAGAYALGQQVAATGALASPFFDLEGADYIKFSLIAPSATDSKVGLVFYDAEEKAIEGVYTHSQEADGYIDREVLVPPGATMVRYTVWLEITGEYLQLGYIPNEVKTHILSSALTSLQLLEKKEDVEEAKKLFTENTVLTAKAIQEAFVSKLYDDTAKGIITFNKGVKLPAGEQTMEYKPFDLSALGIVTRGVGIFADSTDAAQFGGMVGTEADMVSTDYIDLQKADYIDISLLAAQDEASRMGLVFYNKDQEPVKGYYVSGQEADGYVPSKIAVPEAATQIRFSAWSMGDEALYLKLGYFTDTINTSLISSLIKADGVEKNEFTENALLTAAAFAKLFKLTKDEQGSYYIRTPYPFASDKTVSSLGVGKDGEGEASALSALYKLVDVLRDGENDKVSGAEDGNVLMFDAATGKWFGKKVDIPDVDFTEVNGKIADLQGQLNTLVSGNASSAIESFNEVVAFLKDVEDTDTLEGILAGKQNKITETNKLAYSLISGTPTKLSDFEDDIVKGKYQPLIDATNKLDYSLISNTPSLADFMGSSVIGGTASSENFAAVYWDGSAWKTRTIYKWALASAKPSYTTSEVTEGTRLYFTDARAKSALKTTTDALSDRIAVFEKMFQWGDGDGSHIKTPYALASDSTVSSLGVGSDGTGGVSYDRLDSWDNYDADAGAVLSATLGYELKQAIENIDLGDFDLSGYLSKEEASKTYATIVSLGSYQPLIADLATIRENAVLGKEAQSWGDHKKGGYALAASLATVATTGSYSDLKNVPTKLSDFTDDVVSGKYQPLISATNKLAYSLLDGAPTALKNPNALNFGEKSYDGSEEKTITADDLGALTEHQTIYALTIKDSAGKAQLTYTPNVKAGEITLTKAMVGLGLVENKSLSTWTGTTNITTLGTVTSGTWKATKIANDYIANPHVTIAGNKVNLGGSLSVATLQTSLDIVTLSTEQTITGKKTFTKQAVFSNGIQIGSDGATLWWDGEALRVNKPFASDSTVSSLGVGEDGEMSGGVIDLTNVVSNIIPASNLSIGSEEKPWENGYFSHLYVGGKSITELLVDSDSFTNLSTRVDVAEDNIDALGLKIQSVESNYVKKGGDTMTGQLASSVADGTAPFVVASKTLVSNLNADLLDGKHLSDILASDITGNAATATYATSAGNADTLGGKHLSDVVHSYPDWSLSQYNKGAWAKFFEFSHAANNLSAHVVIDFFNCESGAKHVFGRLHITARGTALMTADVANWGSEKCPLIKITSEDGLTFSVWMKIIKSGYHPYLKFNLINRQHVTYSTTVTFQDEEPSGTNTDYTVIESGFASKLTTPRTLWGQSFDGSGNISGNLTGVSNITGTAGISINTTGLNGILLRYNSNNATSVALYSTAFRPMTEANGVFDLGSTSARWKDIYGQTLDLTGSVSLGTADTSIGYKQGGHVVIRGTETGTVIAANGGSITFRPKGNTVVTGQMALYPSGDLVVGHNGELTDNGYKLDVNGSFHASGDATIGGTISIKSAQPTISFYYNNATSRTSLLSEVASGVLSIGAAYNSASNGYGNKLSITSNSALNTDNNLSEGLNVINHIGEYSEVGTGIRFGSSIIARAAKIYYIAETTWANAGGIAFYNNESPITCSEKLRLTSKGHLIPKYSTSTQSLGSSDARWFAYLNSADVSGTLNVSGNAKFNKILIGSAEIYCDAEGVLRTNASFASDRTVSSLGVGSDEDGGVGSVIDLTNVVTSIVPSMDGLNLGTAASRWDVLYAKGMNITDSVVFATSSSVIAYGTFKAASIDGDLTPAVDGEYNIGSPAMCWNEIYANDVEASVITEGGLRVATKNWVENNYVTIAGQQIITGLKYFSQVPAIDLGTSKLLLATMNDVPSITPLQDSGTEIARIDLGGKQVFLYAPNVNIPSLEGYATTSFVENAIKDLSLGTASKKDWVGAAATDPSRLVTEDWVGNELSKLVYITGGSQTQTSNADGGNNIFTFTKSDGSTATFIVKNGSKGADGIDGTDGIDGIDGTSVTITKLQQNNTAGGTSVITFSDGNTLSIKNGTNGVNATTTAIATEDRSGLMSSDMVRKLNTVDDLSSALQGLSYLSDVEGIDANPVVNSKNLVTSGGVYSYVLQEINTINESLAVVATSGKYDDLSGTPTLGTAASKGFTTSVTSGSTDLVTSGAVYTSINSLGSSISGLNGEVSTMKTLVNDHQGKLQSLTSTTGLASGYIKQLKADTLDLGGSTVATMDDLDGYLSLSGGGTISGYTEFQNGLGLYGSTYPALRFTYANTNNIAWIVYGGGSTWFVTNDKWASEYSLLHSGNYTDYALSKDGGTINGYLGIGIADTQGYNLFVNGFMALNGELHSTSNAKFNGKLAFTNWNNYITLDSDDYLNIKGNNAIYLNSSDVLVYNNIGDDSGSYENWCITCEGEASFTSVNQTSDERLKNILNGDFRLSLATMANAPLVIFDWNNRSNKKHNVGTIAQYWQGALPEVVSTTQNGTLALSYGELGVAMGISLANHLTELKADLSVTDNEVDKLKKRVEELETENKRLQERVNALVA